ncbi:hypothetical protein IGJ01_003277 [Enterococcus sp. AZ089]|jgi:hypothetical protein|nr:hypothetical protein YS9_3183 [Enterococcus sp. C1]
MSCPGRRKDEEWGFLEVRSEKNGAGVCSSDVEIKGIFQRGTRRMDGSFNQ